MKILYVASDQVVPGRTGGSIHVLEVARGLARRGHEVHTVIHRSPGRPDREDEAVEPGRIVWHRIAWTPDHRFFRLRARAAVGRIADEARPDVLMERYYNFGGEGVLAGAERGVPALLEVNSPVVDHPGSWKARLDALLLRRPFRRHRERLVRQAAALVSPLHEIVPEFARAKTEIVTWGADVDAFRPDRRDPELRRRLGVPETACLVLFCGSFRPWHGVDVLEAAARSLRDRANLYFVLAGGPGAAEAQGFRGRHLGALPYDQMPALVASADVAVAPYDTARQRQLALGFYWSPLKVFEAMAAGVATVTIPRFPLTEIVRDGQEGLHFQEADPQDLARALLRLAEDPGQRRRMGASARERVVERYSWAVHCEQLERVLVRIGRAA